MKGKAFVLSNSGLKNLVLDQENEFKFIFGEHEFSLNSVLAEFLSPIVSRLHRSDPTINSFNFNNILNKSFNTSSFNYAELFDEKTLKILKLISNGFSIEINEKQCLKLRFISILLDNKEIFNRLNDLFPNEINESNIDQIIQELLVFHNYSKSSNNFDYMRYINFISSHFYSIDHNKLVKLPKSLLYSIISNKNLKIESEDSLLDFINDSFYKDEEEEEEYDDNEEEDFDIIDFYEKIEFAALSESRFRDFLEDFDSNEITSEIWRKLCCCFYINYQSSESFLKKERYSMTNIKNFIVEEYQYDGNTENCFQGIIHHLSQETGGNVADNGTIDVTSSSVNGSFHPKYVVDLEDNQHYFQSKNQQDSWIKFDFKERKVQPKHYTIRTRHDWGKGGGHLKNWVIEGSNTDKNDDWKILDNQTDVSLLDDQNAQNTFKINYKFELNECFRYLRLRQTGANTDGKNYLFISALEFFGSLYQIDQ